MAVYVLSGFFISNYVLSVSVYLNSASRQVS